MDYLAIKGMMMGRQCLVQKARTHMEYERLFRMMQPVEPVYFSHSGEASSLVHSPPFSNTRKYNGKGKGHEL